MKILTLSLAIVCLSGCSTVSNLVEKYTDVSCSKQIEIADTTIDTATDAIEVSYLDGIITHSKKKSLTDRLLVLNDDISKASAQCTHNPDTGKEMALKAVTAIETLEGEI